MEKAEINESIVINEEIWNQILEEIQKANSIQDKIPFNWRIKKNWSKLNIL